MASASAGDFGRHLSQLFGVGSAVGLTDGELLQRFAHKRDAAAEAAFETLLARHGAMVLTVCRQILGDAHAAEDAFQATFLVVVRRASSLRVREPGALGPWLHGVAYRIALKARQESARRRAREQQVAATEVEMQSAAIEHSELQASLHAEVNRLPAKYRAPMVLCYFEGRTHDEAAAALQWPVGTVRVRLARARDLLRSRLARRGFGPDDWVGALLLEPLARIEPSARLLEATVAAAIQGTPAATVSAMVNLMLRNLLMARLVPAAVVLIALTMAGLGLAKSSAPAMQTGPRPGPAPALAPRTVDPDDPAYADRYVGQVLGPDGGPLAGARVYLMDPDANPSEERPVAPVRAVTDRSGRFRFSAPDWTDRALDGLPVRRAGLLIAMAESYGPDWVRTWQPKTTEWTLKLVRDVPIHGLLLDQEGRPLVDVNVKVMNLSVPDHLDDFLNSGRGGFLHPGYRFRDSLYWPSFAPGMTGTAITDHEGRFRVAGLGGERVTTLNYRGAAISEWNNQVMTRDAPDVVRHPNKPASITYGAGFTLRLKPGRTVAGIVRDKQTGEPLPGMWVSPSYVPESRGDFPATDVKGRFTITGLSPEHKTLAIWTGPPPGSRHFMAMGDVPDHGDVVIECPRGIPYRLSLVDEAGKPVEAVVNYYAVDPNPNVSSVLADPSQGLRPFNRAKRLDDDSYLGAVLPGPGAVFATPRRGGYRPAHVDPKAFFAPGKSDWKPEDEPKPYGNHEIIVSPATWLLQRSCSAIILVNPPADSAPLELSATVIRDRPRQVTLLDPDGKPLIGVQAQRETGLPWNQQAPLRAASFPLMGLLPDRLQPILFVHNAKKLIGFLMARRDSDEPYTVRLEPWGTIRGRLFDEGGQPRARVGLTYSCERAFPSPDDPWHGVVPLHPHPSETDTDGRFTLEPVFPGVACTIRAWIEPAGRPARSIEIEDIKVASGRVRDLGDIHLKTTPDHP